MTPVQRPSAEPGGREVRGDLEPIPGQLALPGMPSAQDAVNGQLMLPGLGQLTDPPGSGDPELAAVAAELAALDSGGARMGAAIRGALDMLLDGQHTGRYRWDQLHKTENLVHNREPAGRARAFGGWDTPWRAARTNDEQTRCEQAPTRAGLARHLEA